MTEWGFDTKAFIFTIKVFFLLFVIGLVATYAMPYVLTQVETRNSQSTNAARFVDEHNALPHLADDVPPLPTLHPNEPITIGFVGDIMLDRGIKNVVERRGGDYSYMFEPMQEYLRSFDALFGNLEGPISHTGFDQRGLYSFNMDPKALPALVQNGFSVLSLANNHSGDWGDVAITDSLRNVREAGIAAVGTGHTRHEAYAPEVIKVKDTRIAFVAMTDIAGMYIEKDDPAQPHVAQASLTAIRDAVTEARSLGDIVVFSIHFGDEYTLAPNARQELLARAAIDAGANIVIGHHPHSVQTTEEYNGGYIAYSLGNFIFDQNFSPETATGLLLRVTLVNKRIAAIEKVPLAFSPTYQPYRVE